jgi:transcriptional regulator
MYIPPYYREEDPGKLLAFMRTHPFGVLVSQGDKVPAATHLPFLFYEQEEKLVLKSHLSRANPQWAAFDGQRMAKTIFSGPHAYISPLLYSNPVNVPTWNYVAVHASGKPRIMDDPRDSIKFLEELIRVFDPAFVERWQALPADYIEGLHKGIVAFEMEVEILEGAFKLNQNKPVQDRMHIIDTLGSGNDSNIVEMTAYMQQYLDKQG